VAGVKPPGLFTDNAQGGASWSGFYTDDFALGAALVPARSMLALGMGAGGGIASTIAVAPQIRIDAVEIDPKLWTSRSDFLGCLRAGKIFRVCCGRAPLAGVPCFEI